MPTGGATTPMDACTAAQNSSLLDLAHSRFDTACQWLRSDQANAAAYGVAAGVAGALAAALITAAVEAGFWVAQLILAVLAAIAAAVALAFTILAIDAAANIGRTRGCWRMPRRSGVTPSQRSRVLAARIGPSSTQTISFAPNRAARQLGDHQSGGPCSGYLPFGWSRVNLGAQAHIPRSRRAVRGRGSVSLWTKSSGPVQFMSARFRGSWGGGSEKRVGPPNRTIGDARSA
jgi:hypothetical protein